jgi:UV DNA damage endonuclease
MPGASEQERRLGFAVKVMAEALPSHDTRRWRSSPSLAVSIEALHRIVGYLGRAGIRMYRMSSDFVPYVTHPDMPQFHRQIEEHAPGLERVGSYAQSVDIRLSLHPSQYIVLNARADEIARKSILDLDAQAKLLDAMGQGSEAVVVLHIGGLYADRTAARERFVRNFARLSAPAQRRLVIENDDAYFTVQDCLWVHERTDVPVVFDHQHHRVNPCELPTVEAARAALATWPAGVVPKIHFSSARLDGREVKRGRALILRAPLLKQHADYIDPWTFTEFMAELRNEHFDVMLEAKAKDLALLKLRRDLVTLGREDALRSRAD